MHKSINSKNDDIYETLKNINVSNNLNENVSLINQIFNNSNSLIKKDLTFGSSIHATLFYVDETIDEKILDQTIIKPILDLKDSSIEKDDISIDYIQSSLIPTCKIHLSNTYDVLVYEAICGSAIIFIDGQINAFMIKIPNTKSRNIEKPDTEQTVSGVIDENLPSEILKRLSCINVDEIVDSSQIQALIQEHKWTIFPQLLTTERIDRTISEIIKGKAIILLEGTPFALILPTTLHSFLSSQDDIYGRSIITSILKIIRYIGFLESCSISALYLALTTYHPGLLPTSLALSITGTRVGLPFPVAIEIILMEITLYLVQEAALRLPKAVGNTVGIVGGLVIGQSVVLAGIISPIIVVIVSMSAISSFTLPNYNFALSTIAIRLF